MSLKSIGSKDLTEDVFASNFEKLKYLSISGYEGYTLSVNIFKNTQNLEVLRIRHNNLKALPYQIFKYLEKLKFLDLSYNKLDKFGM